MTPRQFAYRLFFTRDDDLDLLQVFYLAAIVFFFSAFSLEATGAWKPSERAWDMFRDVFFVLTLVGVPTWLAKMFLEWKRGAA